jgi:hypothetical protein
MASSIHYNASNRWADAHSPSATSFTPFDILVLFVAYRTYCCQTIHAYHSHLAAWQAKLGVFFVLSCQLSAGTGCASQLSALSWLQLNRMDWRAGRYTL